MSLALLKVSLRSEHDVVVARQRARQVARHLGFDAQDQARISTAVSEIARNVVQYAGTGEIEFSLEGRTAPQRLRIQVRDQGPGIADLELILSGSYRSKTGMGLGLVGARRLMDHFEAASRPGAGTEIVMGKLLPRAARALDAAAVGQLARALTQEGLQNPLAEVQHQNQELLRALEELRRRQEDLVRLNRELEDTNRGVLALYAELDEKAEHLRRAAEIKTRLLSNMSHELRTPLNSILAISRLLAQRSDGELSSEQEKQVRFVLKAAGDLTELVDDLLDLAKVEAGRVLVRPADFELGRLFGALRGMLRPLLVGDAVRLVFDEPRGLPEIYADEGKVSQILRNFLSNALKFTEQGEIRVWATVLPGSRVRISVSDTGIGIAAQDQAGIFEEFGQVEHALQARVKGTGLGLALSRRLAEVLGGAVSLESKLGEGSTFTLELPLRYEERPQALPTPVALAPEQLAAPGERTLLVVDDDAAARYILRDLAGRLGFEVAEASDGPAGLRAAEQRPTAVVLDLVMSGLGGEEVLRRLRAQPATAALPVVVATSKVLEEREKEGLERLSAIVLPKSALGSSDAVRHLADALRRAGCPGTLLPLPAVSPEPVA